MSDTLLSCSGLTFQIPESGLKTISFNLESGGVIQVRGPSGSGKTTMLKILARLRPADSGEINFNGNSAAAIDPNEWRRKVVYVSQKPAFMAGTGLENLKRPFDLKVAAGVPYPYDAARKLSAELGLSDELLARSVNVLSGGEAARLAVVRAMIVKPRVVLLDEPAASLDEALSAKLAGVLSNWLAQSKGGIVFVAHDNSFADRFPDRLQIDLTRSVVEAHL